MTTLSRFFLHDINVILESWSIRQIGAALALGITLGFIVLTLNPPQIISGMMGLIVLVATFTHPEFVILVVLALVSGLVPGRFNLPIRLPLGTFYLSDLLLIWLLFLVVFRVFTDKMFPHVKTPLDTPVLLFFVAVVVAMGTSMFRYGARLKEAQIEARVLMYYLIFFVVTHLIRTRRQLVRVVQGIFAIGLLVAGAMIIQASLGRSVLLMDEEILRGGQLARFFHPGTTAIYIALITLICGIALRRRHRYGIAHLLQALVLVVGLVLTLGRSLLISGTISLVALTIILRRLQLSRLTGYLLLSACIAVAVVVAFGIIGNEFLVLEYASAFLGRITSMFSETVLTSEETLVSRWVEIQYAWARIVEHPIFGIGLWHPYRPRFHEGDTLTHYVHNAYVWIWLRTGLLGLVPFLWFCVRFLQHGFRHWREVRDDFLRTVTLGFTLAYLGMMISNLTSPFFVQDWSLAIFGVILGINESLLIHNRETDKNKGEAWYDLQHTSTAG